MELYDKKFEWDTQEQNRKFQDFLMETCDIYSRTYRLIDGKPIFGYDEAEWDAFQYGWNAAKEHFGVD